MRVMDKGKAWRTNIVLHYIVLVMAVVILGINIYNYSLTQQIDWLHICLGIVMIFSAVFNILNAKREIKKEEQ